MTTNKGPYSRDTKLNRLSEKRMERVVTVGKLYLQGKTIRAIAELSGISTAQVLRDLKHAKELWRQASMAALNDLLTVEMARIDQIEAEAWRGWMNSQTVMKETNRKKTIEGGEEGDISTEVSVKKRQLYGDAAFLKIALDCVDRRTKILLSIKDEGGESDDIVVQAVEVIVDNREQALEMIEFEDFRKVVKQ